MGKSTLRIIPEAQIDAVEVEELSSLMADSSLKNYNLSCVRNTIQWTEVFLSHYFISQPSVPSTLILSQ